jgi:acetate kinase
MGDAILTLNAGSSSLKFAAFEAESGALNLIASGQIEGIGATATGSVKSAAGQKASLGVDSSNGRVDHDAAMGSILHWMRKAGFGNSVAAVGHRVVRRIADSAAALADSERDLRSREAAVAPKPSAIISKGEVVRRQTAKCLGDP